MKRKALGKGIQSLIPEAPAGEKLQEVDISRIQPSPYQPRRHFDDAKLQELADSIQASGIIQPVVLAREKDGNYTLIAGERRWRAAQKAGLHRVPAVIRDLPDEKKAEHALIENIQRQDLNPVEEALAYQTLLDTFELTQDELAKRIGKSRESITNLVGILKLPESVQADIERGTISLGHAKVLKGLGDTDLVLALAEKIRGGQLTVRSLEDRIRQLGKKQKVSGKPGAGQDVFLRDAEDRLGHRLKTRVSIKGSAGRGTIAIHYTSKEQLNGLFESLMKR